MDEDQVRELTKSLSYIADKMNEILISHWENIERIPHESKEDDYLSCHSDGIFYRYKNMIYRSYHNHFTKRWFVNETEAAGHFELIRMVARD